MTDSLAIETRGLTRTFGSCKAVDGLDLRVTRGTIYGFLGPNGAGKTTTIRLLLGLLRPNSGSILLNGELLSQKRRELMRGIGALVETPSLYAHLTGRENLEVTRRMRNLPGTCVTEALAFSGLRADADRVVRGYSLGMRQRLGLAQAWLGQPGLMLLDEPANGLDPAGIRELRDRLRQLASEQHVTVFLSSHVLSEVEQVADWIGIINRGRLIFQGRLHELHRYQPPLNVITDRNADAAAVLKAKGCRVLENSGEGVVYLAVVLDAYSRRAIGWALEPHLAAELPLAALRQALQHRVVSPGLVHHSDRGTQYCSRPYLNLLADFRIQISMSRPGCPYVTMRARRAS